MKDKKPSKKGLDLKTFVVIVLAVFIGLGIAFSIFNAVEHAWTEFAVCLAVTVVLFIIECPLAYKGDTFECPKCGHQFKANPYKVFFTNGILHTFSFDGAPMKYAKLRCPKCNTKDWCKRRWE